MRHPFGGDVAGFVFTPATSGSLTVPSLGPTMINCWDSPVGGNQYIDLLAADGVTPITQVQASSNGFVPNFFGPDTIQYLYYDGGAGYRLKAMCLDLPDTVNGLTAASVGADPAGYADSAITTFQTSVDPLGDRAFTEQSRQLVVVDCISLGSVPLRASVNANQSQRFLWLAAAGSPPAIGNGYVAEGDRVDLEPLS